MMVSSESAPELERTVGLLLAMELLVYGLLLATEWLVHGLLLAAELPAPGLAVPRNHIDIEQVGLQ